MRLRVAGPMAIQKNDSTKRQSLWQTYLAEPPYRSQFPWCCLRLQRHQPADQASAAAQSTGPQNPAQSADGSRAGEELQELVITGVRESQIRSIEAKRLAPSIFLEELSKDEVCRRFNVDRDYLRVLLHRARLRPPSPRRRPPRRGSASLPSVWRPRVVSRCRPRSATTPSSASATSSGRAGTG